MYNIIYKVVVQSIQSYKKPKELTENKTRFVMCLAGACVNCLRWSKPSEHVMMGVYLRSACDAWDRLNTWGGWVCLPEVWDPRRGADPRSGVHYEELTLLYHLCQTFNLLFQLLRTIKFLSPHRKTKRGGKRKATKRERHEPSVRQHWAGESMTTHTHNSNA